jgi:hypothetical protein
MSPASGGKLVTGAVVAQYDSARPDEVGIVALPWLDVLVDALVGSQGNANTNIAFPRGAVQLGCEATDPFAPAQGTATYCRPATLAASHTKKAKNYAPHLIRELDELGDFTIREPEPAMGELLNDGSIGRTAPR